MYLAYTRAGQVEEYYIKKLINLSIIAIVSCMSMEIMTRSPIGITFEYRTYHLALKTTTSSRLGVFVCRDGKYPNYHDLGAVRYDAGFCACTTTSYDRAVAHRP